MLPDSKEVSTDSSPSPIVASTSSIPSEVVNPVVETTSTEEEHHQEKETEHVTVANLIQKFQTLSAQLPFDLIKLYINDPLQFETYRKLAVTLSQEQLELLSEIPNIPLTFESLQLLRYFSETSIEAFKV